MERDTQGKKSMKRIYESGITDTASMFIGTEVEHTPMLGERTLFVVGIQDPEEVAKVATFENIKHIYLGANHSFSITDKYGTEDEINGWEGLVFGLLKKGFWVTLDFDVKYVEWILEAGFPEYNNFIPMISVKIPYIEQLRYNACLKIDDKDFDASNPGVWVHSVHNLMSRAVYTDWSKYTKDTIVS